MAYIPKTQLAAKPYIKDGLTTILLGNTEYVRLRDVVGKDLKSYRRHCSEGSTILVKVDNSPTWFVRITEIDKLRELRNLNQQRYRTGRKQVPAKKEFRLSDFGKGWTAKDLRPSKPKTIASISTKEFVEKFGVQFSKEEPVVVNGVEVFTSPDFGSIRTKLEKDGTVYFNLEDVARGLGFTKTEEKFSTTSGRKSYDSIRWNTVHKYLMDFGVATFCNENYQANCPEYIPENIFYRLALKAKNKVAEAFQIWICDEVIPKIRKQGYYVRPDIKPVQNNNTDELLEALKTQLAIQTKIVELLEQKNLR